MAYLALHVIEFGNNSRSDTCVCIRYGSVCSLHIGALVGSAGAYIKGETFVEENRDVGCFGNRYNCFRPVTRYYCIRVRVSIFITIDFWQVSLFYNKLPLIKMFTQGYVLPTAFHESTFLCGEYLIAGCPLNPYYFFILYPVVLLFLFYLNHHQTLNVFLVFIVCKSPYCVQKQKMNLSNFL